MRKRALISVFKKDGVEELAGKLIDLGFEIWASEGTYSYLDSKLSSGSKSASLKKISSITGFTELLGGRVKTLDSRIFAGVLYRNEEEAEELEQKEIPVFKVVYVDLYDFEEGWAQQREGKRDFDSLVELIDIGGVSLLRAAAKNFRNVAVAFSREDIPLLLKAVEEDSLKLRKELARKVFNYTSFYDALIGRSFFYESSPLDQRLFALPMKKIQDFRYGENPHQRGALYRTWLDESPFEQLWGKEISYNNVQDFLAGWSVVLDLKRYGFPSCVIVKHGGPCGASVNPSQKERYLEALSGDPVAAFGGIVFFSDRVEAETASLIVERFYEMIVAPDFSPEALEVLKTKKKLIILKTSLLPWFFEAKVFGNIALLQESDIIEEVVLGDNWKVITSVKPTPEQFEDAKVAWAIVKGLRSNAIAVVKGGILVGSGSGSPSRVEAVKIALEKAGERAKGAVMASEAFFPFPDSVELAHRHGVAGIVQPGGSIRDNEVVEAAEKLGLFMIITGVRHFKH